MATRTGSWPEGAPASLAVATRRTASSGQFLGNLHEFCPDAETFSVYLERVSIFFAVNDIAPQKKLPVFLNCVECTTYGVLRNLVALMNMSVVGKLAEHFDPKPLIIAERYHFHKRDEAPTESLAEYIAELRRLAARCNFGTYLDDALRDRLVCGLRSESVQKRLLSESDLDLSKAVRIANAMEAAHNDTQTSKTLSFAPRQIWVQYVVPALAESALPQERGSLGLLGR